MIVHIQGQGSSVSLTQRDYVGGGGEGAVYKVGKIAYKIYHDPAKMIPVAKFKELSVITDPHVIRPQSMLVDAKGLVVGYTMPFLDGGYPLCQLFPRSFRDREGVTTGHITNLVAKMQAGIQHVHQTGTLIVDLNEMNFLVDKKFDDLFFIDVDSYQTPHFPATVIMDSIRDWSVHHNQWSTNSDWYSFGILSFQMYTGIHPFRGKYHGPKAEFRGRLPSDPDDDAFATTRRRMLGGISVMHPEVGIPGSAYPLSVIPKEYRQWYEDMFVNGQRCPPPSKAGAMGVILFVPQVNALSGTLVDFMELWNLQYAITSFLGSSILGGNPVITAGNKVYLGGALVPVPWDKPTTVCGHTNRTHRVVVGSLEGTKLSLFNLTDRVPLTFDMEVQNAVSYEGRIYVRTEDQIHEVALTDAGSQVLATLKVVCNVMPHATHLFSGVAIQSMLGATFVSLFTGPGEAQQVRVKELDTFRVVDAKYDRGVLMVLTEKAGKYDRQVFRFEADGTYDIRVVADVSSGQSLNFVTLDNGVCVCMNEDEKLELFSARKGSSSIKTVEDKTLSGALTLARHEGSLVAYQGTKVLKLKMK